MDKSHLAPGGLEPASHGGHGVTTPGTESHEDFFSTHLPSRPASVFGVKKGSMNTLFSPRLPRKLVLCFDGTGNQFRGDDADSNILKIFRMLDRTADDQCKLSDVQPRLNNELDPRLIPESRSLLSAYVSQTRRTAFKCCYLQCSMFSLTLAQAGIGTYVVSNHLSHTGTLDKIKSWYMKAKDEAIGSSFDQHVVGGYRFLMRFYSPMDEIYIFGFSRGAYIARFLAEMLDYIGLLSHGNEEMVSFAWNTFAQWQARRTCNTPVGIDKKKKMYAFMKGFRETFSRPVRRIRFLGLFDTVNSVPRFETAWMERSKFPYTARTSARVIRHAVSIDERRAKFRQDLSKPSTPPRLSPSLAVSRRSVSCVDTARGQVSVPETD
jgi:uncharacterized protein (DUF2235 family)